MAKLSIPDTTSALNRLLVSMTLVFLFLLMLWLLVLVDVGYAQPALAVVRQQEESPGQQLYQSRQTLRDTTGSTWQVILFKRVQENTLKAVNLRLVGFPETTRFLHPQPLRLSTQGGLNLPAEDLFAQRSPAANVGEYDLQDILPKLPVSEAVTLELPLESPRKILVPIPVLLEWQTLK
ncbi:MAG: DUF3122 domain-containing protein [Snowella sp.]|nr:DUF3122 domain-containing protein [Snowella sp.]